jgi:hypothetical protein
MVSHNDHYVNLTKLHLASSNVCDICKLAKIYGWDLNTDKIIRVPDYGPNFIYTPYSRPSEPTVQRGWWTNCGEAPLSDISSDCKIKTAYFSSKL